MDYADRGKLGIVYGDVTLGVHGEDFHLIFSYQTGGLESMVKHGKESRNPAPSSISAIRSFLTRQETISRPPCCLSSRKTLRDCTGCARPSSPDRAPASSIILWPPRSTYPITRKIMRNTHASPAGSTSLAPWPSSREEEKP